MERIRWTRRPKTKLLRDFARKIAEEAMKDGKKLIARKFVGTLVEHALKGSLGHFQQFLQLVESDAPGADGPETAD